MKQHEIDELLAVDEVELNPKQLSKKLRKSVNQHIYSRVVISFLILVLIIGGGYWIRNVYLEKTSYNPLKEDEMMYDEKEGSGFSYLMEIVFNNYDSSGMLTGIEYRQKTGPDEYSFYSYTVPFLDAYNLYGKYGVKYGNMSHLDVEHSRVSIEQLNNYAMGPSSIRRIENDVSVQYQEIQKLPESCILDVSIVFPEQKNMDELASFINLHPEITYGWIVKEVGAGTLFYGMSLMEVNQRTFHHYDRLLKNSLKETYPNLILTELTKIDGETLSSHFLSTIQLLLDHQDFLEMMNGYYCPTQTELQEAYDNAIADGFYAKGVRCVMSQPELLSLIDQGEISNICVHDLKLSYLQQ